MVMIKRYPNRKLYNTVSKQYVTLEGIAELIRQGGEVRVVDHASGEDLTALTLTQIILEHERKRGGLLSNAALTALIRLGSDRISALQRSLLTASPLRRQVDELIKFRVQELTHQGKISKKQGQQILEQLLDNSAEREPGSMADSLTDEKLVAYLQERQIPTQEDIQRLSEQLEDLAIKLDGLA